MKTIAIIGALLAGLLAGCGTGSGLRGAGPTATSTAPTARPLPLEHVKMCHYWEMGAGDGALSQFQRKNAQRYYDLRCQDVAESERTRR